MSRPLFRAYFAVSLDGCIADAQGGVSWLDPYKPEDYGYSDFIAEVGTIVMGRTTYDQMLGFGSWPYGGKRSIVLTSRPLDYAPSGVEVFSGPVRDLAARLASAGGKDVWIMGGARTLRGFIEVGAVDRFELFIIPLLLGEGLSLFESPRTSLSLRLEETERFIDDVVKLVYSVG